MLNAQNVPVRVAALGGARYCVHGTWCTEGKVEEMSFFPRSILLATDGSRGTLGDQAAIELSKATDSEMHVLYVLPSPGADWSSQLSDR